MIDVKAARADPDTWRAARRSIIRRSLGGGSRQIRLQNLRHALVGVARADEIGHGEDALVGVRDRDAVAGPLQQLDVVLAVAESDGALALEADVGGEEEEGDAAAGESVFASAGCGGCHVLEAAGTSGSVGPNLDDSQPDFELVVDRVTNGSGAMPSFSDKLSEDEIKNVAAYVVESTSG